MRTAVLFLAAIILMSCENSDNLITKDYSAYWEGTDSASVCETFTKAYQNYSEDSSGKHIDSLFDSWSQMYQSDENDLELDDYGQAALEVYKAAYKPLGFSERVGASHEDLYVQADFLVVDCSFDYLVTSGFDEDQYEPADTLDRGSVSDAMPQLDLEKPYVYLTSSIESGIESFLGDEYSDASSTFEQPVTAGETKRRMDFLSTRIDMTFADHVSTRPLISDIWLNEDLDVAYVSFILINERGFIRLEKTDGEWDVVDSQLTVTVN